MRAIFAQFQGGTTDEWPASGLYAALPNLWDDAHAAGLDEPGLLLYRSNLLGSDLRITNFGGGNTSAKVDGTDPLSGETVEGAVGQRLGRRHRLDEARRLLDPLSRQAARPEERLSRPRARGRDGGAVQPLHLRPQSARDLDRHAAARLHPPCACRSRACRRGHRHRRLRERRSADPHDLWRRDGLPALAAAGLRSRIETRRDGRGEPASEGRGARRPRALHLGPDLEGLLRDDARHDQQGLGLARGQRQGRGLRRRSGSIACRPRRAATLRRSSCRRSAGASRRASARSAISPTRRKCWSSSIRAI